MVAADHDVVSILCSFINRINTMVVVEKLSFESNERVLIKMGTAVNSFVSGESFPGRKQAEELRPQERF